MCGQLDSSAAFAVECCWNSKAKRQEVQARAMSLNNRVHSHGAVKFREYGGLAIILARILCFLLY